MTMAGAAERGDGLRPPDTAAVPLDELDVEEVNLTVEEDDDVVEAELVEHPEGPDPGDDEDEADGRYVPVPPTRPAAGTEELRPDGKPKWADWDWDLPKRYYVEGVKTAETHEFPTLAQVAEKFGIPEGRVRDRSASKGWRAERTQYQHQIETTRRQARAAAMVQQATQLDNDALKTAKVGLMLVHAKLLEVAQAAQAARAGGAGSGATIDALEQQRLAAAADLWHKIGLRAVGDPETHRLEVTGANGAPIEIAAELRRDDPERITNVLNILNIAGVGDLFSGRADAERTLAAGRGADGDAEASGAGR